MREKMDNGDEQGLANRKNRSSKSALHGLVHWLANAYAHKGITVNGVAPALVQDTKMLPGSSDELSKSTVVTFLLHKLIN
jgi:3-oxoacyl-[acyl-carrier protein] reductase